MVTGFGCPISMMADARIASVFRENWGGGLLGHALARRAGIDYEALLRSRICDPLGMSDTRITLTPEMKARLAVGTLHHRAGLLWSETIV